MIKRNLHFAPHSVKAKAYLATVRPILEYGSVCWSPPNLQLNHQLEGIQNSAAKWVTNSYPRKGQYKQFSILKLIKSLGWHSLEERRDEAMLTMAFKILNNLGILNPDNLPTPPPTRGASCQTQTAQCPRHSHSG